MALCFVNFTRGVVALAASAVLIGQAAAAEVPDGGHWVFAAGYGTKSEPMDNYVLIGELDFSERDAAANYAEYEADADRKPSKAAPFLQDLQAPYGVHNCVNKVIDIPTPSAHHSSKAKWTRSGNKLQITVDSLNYEWQADPAGGDGAYKLTKLTDNSGQEMPLAVGYAYAAKKRPDLAPLRREKLLPYYNGDIYHKDNYAYAPTAWKAMPTGLKISIFTERYDGNVLSYSSPGTVVNKGAWVGNSLLLNYDKSNPMLIYQDLGHDFDKNGCYDEYGHAKAMLAAPNGDENVISRMVFIEQSYSFKGFPLLSVGRYHR